MERCLRYPKIIHVGALVGGLLVTSILHAQSAPDPLVDEEETIAPRLDQGSQASPSETLVDEKASMPVPVMVPEPKTEKAPAKPVRNATTKSRVSRKRSKTRLLIAGYVQAQGVLWNQASVDELDPVTSEPLNETRFLVRRARIGIEVQRGLVGGGFALDGNTLQGARARILSAEMNVRLPWSSGRLPLARARIGLMKIPFGVEVPMSARDRLFLEPSTVARAFFPGKYDLGLLVDGGYRFLRYTVGAMNGNPVSEATQYAARDPNRGKDFIGRVGIQTSIGQRVALRAGVSALVGKGFHAGTPTTKDNTVWLDINQDDVVQLSELQVVAGTPGTPSKNFERDALGSDVSVTVKLTNWTTLNVYGELYWAKNLDRQLHPADPVAIGRDLREFGYYGALELAIHRLTWIGVRYDHYDPDNDATDAVATQVIPVDATFSMLAVAASWEAAQNSRLVLQYEHNTNPLGRSAAGTPTTLRSDALTLRGQVAF